MTYCSWNGSRVVTTTASISSDAIMSSPLSHALMPYLPATDLQKSTFASAPADDLRALKSGIDAFDVGTADCAGTYQTNSQFFHDNFLLIVLLISLILTFGVCEDVLVTLYKKYLLSGKYLSSDKNCIFLRKIYDFPIYEDVPVNL